MVQACVLIRVKPGYKIHVSLILPKLARFKEVKKSFLVFGRYDAVAFIKASDRDTLVKIAGKINSLECIKCTETLIEG